MHASQPAQPSVLSDPLFRKPHLPGSLRTVDLILSVLAVGGMLVAFSQGLAQMMHADPRWIEAASLEELAREVAHSQAHLVSILVSAAVGLFGSVTLIMRLLYRVHRCELLLRWSGIDESKLLGGSAPPGAPGRESKS
jgi:hypothetical protein